MPDDVRCLDLEVLAAEPGLPALTTSAGRYLAESAAVCLHHNGLGVETRLGVAGILETEFLLRWPEVNRQMLDTYHDLQDATENGAYGVAILLVRELAGLTVIQRSRKGTGVDYWLGDDADLGDHASLVFERQARLEVSGILKGSPSDVKARLARKRKQVRRSAGLSVFIVIVEFGTPSARVEKSDATADQSAS